MTKEPQQTQVQLDTAIFYLNNLNASFSEEEFLFLIQSGNSARRYLATPKHAKRILLLLQKQIDAYESKFGELETSLLEATTPEEQKQMGFQTQDESSPSARE